MINSRIKILITGGGGVTGRAVARSIKLSKLYADAVLISSDIYQNKFGIFEGLFDKSYKLPHVEHIDYKTKFNTLIDIEKPDVVLLMTEKEVLFWGKYQANFKSLISPFEFSKIAGNKARLYQMLSTSNLVPQFCLFDKNKDSIENIVIDKFKSNPVWIRCYDDGSSSGKGAYVLKNIKDAEAWMTINEKINHYMISELLKGENYACNLLYVDGKFIQHAIYERLEYFMPHLSPSGITGNISVGKLINNEQVLENSIAAIEKIEKKTNTKANGIYTVDLLNNSKKKPLITEINLRHTAATSSFAQGKWNMVEFQISATLERFDKIPNQKPTFNQNNLILRDIDGLPIYLEESTTAFQKQLIDLT
jgi:hypothetical protein